MQDTFLEAWRSIGNLREASSGRAWLFRILRHRHSHLVRDSGRRLHAAESLDHADDAPCRPGQDVLELLSHQEELQNAFDALEVRYKEPFLMAFVVGLSCREVAAELGLPLGTVLSRIHRARVFLRTFLRREGEVPMQEQIQPGDAV